MRDPAAAEVLDQVESLPLPVLFPVAPRVLIAAPDLALGTTSCQLSGASRGGLGFRVGDDELELGAGESLLVTRWTPHSHWNAEAKPVRYCSS